MESLKRPQTSITDRRAWSIPEAGAIYGVSNGFLRRRIKNGDLAARKVGRRVILLDKDLKDLFETPRENRKTRQNGSAEQA